MAQRKTFRIAFLVSFLFHSVFFFGIPRIQFMPSRKSLTALNITYYKTKERPKKKQIVNRKSEPIVKKLPEIKKKDILTSPKSAPKESFKEIKRVKQVRALKKGEEKRFEKVVEEEKDDAKKAVYISYYRAVREKIKECADRNYARKRNLGGGDVFLSFLIASNGELLRVGVVDKKSVKDAGLRTVAIHSIRDANPFSPFPMGMGQYQITFNVIISFEGR